MKNKLLVVCFIFLHFSVVAQQEKWASLFDGKTLHGWRQRGGTATYVVREGEIVGTCADQSPNTFLCSDKMYSDFILEVDLLVEGTLNSGLQIRSKSRLDYKNGQVHGLQVEVDPSERAWSGGLYDEGRREWLYIPNINPAGKKAFRPGQWNTYHIEAIGHEIRTWINGVPVAHLIDSLQERGFLALQVHAPRAGGDDVGKSIHWRNIRLQSGGAMRPWPASACPVINLIPNDLSPTEKAQGWRLLFNGRDLDGWRLVHGKWSIENGELAATENPGELATTQSFRAFELTFDFRLTEESRADIAYLQKTSTSNSMGLIYHLSGNDQEAIGSLRGFLSATTLEKRFQRKPGDWQSGRIVVRPDQVIQHWINGFPVLEQSLTDKNLRSRTSDKEGSITLMTSGHGTAFRSIKIRELK